MKKLYAQETPTATESLNVEVQLDAIEAILSASLVVQITLLILVIFSVLSWSLIFTKYKQFSKVRRGNALFSKLFWNTSSWNELSHHSLNYSKNTISPLRAIFNSGFDELKRLARRSEQKTPHKKQIFNISDIDSVERALRKTIDLEVTKLEFGLSMLATIGSTSPFIGLFGTVWGIMNAFQKIGATGMAHLAIVAPGISEALIATAFGLFVAVPAVIAYNQYLAQVKKIEIDLDHFHSDFLNLARKNFFRSASREHTA